MPQFNTLKCYNTVNKGLYYSWSNNVVPNNSVAQSMTLYITDVTQSVSPSSSIVPISINPYKDGSGNLVTNYTVTNLTPGTSYVASLNILTTDNSGNQVMYYGTCPAVMVCTVPETPVITGYPGNSTIYLEFETPLEQISESDGYSTIENLTIFYSDSSGSGLRVLDLTQVSQIYGSNNLYMITNVNNYVSYELAVSLSNYYGTSSLSNTVVVVPTPAPIPVTSVTAAETADIIQDGSTVVFTNAVSVTVSFPQSPTVGLSDPATASEYAIYRTACDPSGNPNTSTTTQIMDFTVDGSGNPQNSSVVFQGGNYEYVDLSGTVGLVYVYYVVSSNVYGSSQPSPNSNAVLYCGLPGAPTLSATTDPSRNVIIVSVTPPSSLNGGNFNNLYYIVVKDPSGSVVNVPGPVSTDPSGNITITNGGANTTQIPIVSGKTYTVSLQAETTDFQNNTLFGAAGSTTATPYKLPTAPTNLQYSNFDASNIYVGSNKLYISWTSPSVTPYQAGSAGSYTYTFYNQLTPIPSSSIILQKPNSAVITGLTNGVVPSLTMTATVTNSVVGNLTSPQSSNAVKLNGPGYPFGAPSNIQSIVVTSDPSSSTVLDVILQDPLQTGGLSATYYECIAKDQSGNVIVDISGIPWDPSSNFTKIRLGSGAPYGSGLIAGNLYSVVAAPYTLYNGKPYFGNFTQPPQDAAPYLPPAAPTNVTAVAYELNNLSGNIGNGDTVETAVEVTWTNNATNGVNVTFNNIYISINNNETLASLSSYTPNYQASGTATYAIITSLQLELSATYYVYVVPYGSVLPSNLVYGNPSTPVSFNTYVGPVGPTNLVATANSTSGITLNWTQPTITGTPPSNYYIQWATSNSIIGFTSIPIGTTTYNVTGLSVGTIYTFYVSSYYQQNGQNIYSSITASNQASPYSTPSAPTNGTFSISQVNLVNSINLAWRAPTNNGGANQPGNGPLLYEVVLLDGSNVVLDISGISQILYTLTSTSIVTSVNYTAKITAYFSINNGLNDSVSPALYVYNIIPGVAPQSVSSLVATPSAESINLSWVNPTDTSVYVRGNTFIQRYKINALGNSVLDGSFNVLATVTSYTDSSLIDGTSYYYVVSPLVVTINYVGGSIAYPASEVQPSTTSSTVIPFNQPIIDPSGIFIYGNTTSVRYNANGTPLTSATILGSGAGANPVIYVWTATSSYLATLGLGTNTIQATFPVSVTAIFVILGNNGGSAYTTYPPGNPDFVGF